MAWNKNQFMNPRSLKKKVFQVGDMLNFIHKQFDINT